ncbi:MAG TPA: cytochrome c3 family protein [Candidatus Binatus sp.]|nr:cytochrome c3 family protein [Candidatus Binatus sp.]
MRATRATGATRGIERLVRLAILGLGAALLAVVGVQAVSAGPSPSPVVSPIIVPTPAASGTPDTNTCATCHTAIDPKNHDLVGQWQASVHGQNGIACADCHGGDPTSDQVTVAMDPAKGFKGVPGRVATVELCGNCHANVDRMRQYQIPTDELAKYRTSVHRERLFNGDDTKVAICTDCHGVHDVKKASDPTAKVYPLNVPALCASCHADANYMAQYGIPTDQYAIYKNSIHGIQLLQNADVRAPTCASCHGSHDAKPPTSADVVEVCGKCHTATQALYQQSRHAALDVGPKCWTCHGTHDVALPDESRFFHPKAPEIDCTICHNPKDRSLTLQATQFQNDADRRCDTCHHPDSIIYAQARSIYDELSKASTAYNDAQAKINEAAGVGMIVSDADVQLTEAKTSLIQARAAVHTTKLTAVATLADKAVASANDAAAFADSRLSESLFRREAMVVILGLIVINVYALVLIRRRLGHAYASPDGSTEPDEPPGAEGSGPTTPSGEGPPG